METNLSKSDHTLKMLFEEMPWMVSIAKIKDDTFLKTNKMFEEVTGFANNELIGHSLKDLKIFIKPFDLNIFKQKVLETPGVSTFNIIFKSKSENMFKGTLSICRINYENELGILYIINEINTSRKF